MYNPITGRWNSIDPLRQHASPYVGMGNNPIYYVDKDGRWLHVAAGALIGGGIAAYNLYRAGELDGSWRSIGKIAVGAGTGAAIAFLPGAALSTVGQLSTGTIGGVSTGLIGNSLAAGTIAAAGNIADQMIDVHTGHKANVVLSEATVNAGVTALTFEVVGHNLTQARYAARHARWDGTNSQFAKFLDDLPNVAAAAANSATDLFRASIENNWWNFNWSFGGGDNLVRGVTPWGYEYAVPKGQTIVLPKIVITPDPE
jgi:hypothetical protein